MAAGYRLELRRTGHGRVRDWLGYSVWFCCADLRRANFTSADMRESYFSGSTFIGAHLEKAVAYKVNFSGLCQYAKGTNPLTRVDVRKSLGCGNSRINAYGSPSSPAPHQRDDDAQ